MVKIESVVPRSPAARAGLCPGDVLLTVEGKEIRDVLDYQFRMTAKDPQLTVRRGEREFGVVLCKEEYDDAGLEFATYLMDEKHACRNKCIFCFIDQLPRGMRDTLYFKDDDSRLSFLQGNYITMTNLSDADCDRIIEMRMSPVRVSVHTTEPELRVEMMKNPRAGEVLSYLGKFAGAGLDLDCQIVLCRGINDGEHLHRTLADLAALGNAVRSVSVVPAGLTKCREGLYPLTPFSKEEARDVIAMVEATAAWSRQTRGENVFYCSDEWYLTADLPLPAGSYYGSFDQIENGVGMLSSFHDEVTEELAYADEYDLSTPRTVSVATGAAAYEFLCAEVGRITAAAPGLHVNVWRIENDFFGHGVTVAGLVTGHDLIAQLKGRDLGDRLLLPAVMLRHESDVFLDDVTVKDAERALGVPIATNETSGDAFVRALLELPHGKEED